MKIFRCLLLGCVVCFVLPLFVAAQTNCNEGAGALDPTKPTGITGDQIIQKFSAAESDFQRAYESYGFTEDIKVETLEGNDVTGEFRRISNVHFDREKRMQNVTFAPQSSLRGAELSKEDFDDIERTPFILTTKGIADYTVRYAGRQKVDELQTYVFDVAPRALVKGRRYFQGRIWVDQQGLQIVKTCGKGVPDAIPQPSRKKKKRREEEQNVSPTLVTYRELIDGKYWFPTYRRADEVLHVVSGFAAVEVHVREIIKLEEYQRTAAQNPSLMTAKKASCPIVETGSGVRNKEHARKTVSARIAQWAEYFSLMRR